MRFQTAFMTGCTVHWVVAARLGKTQVSVACTLRVGPQLSCLHLWVLHWFARTRSASKTPPREQSLEGRHCGGLRQRRTKRRSV
ncbi:hypothetical protein BDN67DRAFT_972721 [Paxillus ammoniavirescens]|nr:hypothetical protein BDN67DRAFT_972721 [Paxillus ammoniavirescens]